MGRVSGHGHSAVRGTATYALPVRSPHAMILAISVAISVAIILGSIPAPLYAAPVESTMTLTLDGSQRFQTIDGFGVNVNSLPWDNGALAPALAQLSAPFGASVWRVIVESTEGWQDTPDTGNPDRYDWAAYARLYETSKFQALWGVLGYLQQQRVPTIMLNVMGCAPEWMGGCAIAPDKEDSYVKMETSLLYYARHTKHLRIDVFSPMNEEDYGNPEGPRVAPEQYVRILGKLAARMDALGLGDIQLLGPDTASVSAGTSTYIPALTSNPSVMAKIQRYGLHDYTGNADDAAAAIARSAYPNRSFWMTEYSAWCDGCDNGAPNPNNWSFAADTVNDLFNFIQQGASSALVYDGYDSYYEHHGHMGYWGLLAYDATAKTYTPRKRFYALAQVVRFARPGMVRIGASSSEASVWAFAFTDPRTGALTIVGRNFSGAEMTVRGTLAHLATPGALTLYQTTQTRNMARGGPVSLSGNSFTATIAADSVFTITSLPVAGSGAPPTPVSTATTPGNTHDATAAATPRTLGNTQVGASLDTGDANYLNGSRYTTAAVAGTITSMSVHVGEVSPAPHNQFELAIYSDDHGSPGTLVAHSQRGTLVPNAWNTVTIHADLRPNTAYWLMYNTNGDGGTANNMHYTERADVPEAYSASAVPFGAWPDHFGRAVTGTGAFSIYATYATPATAAGSASGGAPLPGWLPVLLLGLALIVLLAVLAVPRLLRRRPGQLARTSRR